MSEILRSILVVGMWQVVSFCFGFMVFELYGRYGYMRGLATIVGGFAGSMIDIVGLSLMAHSLGWVP